MPLDTLERGINVKSLALDQPPKTERAVFDPDRDISEKDWADIVESLEEARTNAVKAVGASNTSYYLDALTSAVLLSPQRSNQLGISNRDLHLIEVGLANPEVTNYRKFLATYYKSMKVLFPEKYRGFLSDSSKVDQVYETLTKDLSKSSVEYMFFGDVEDAVVLFPEKTRNLEIVKKRKDEIHGYLNAIAPQRMWSAFADKAAEFRLIYPESFHELKEVNESSWRSMLNYLKTVYPASNYARTAKSMKILAAQDIKITDKDFQIVMSKPEGD